MRAIDVALRGAAEALEAARQVADAEAEDGARVERAALAHDVAAEAPALDAGTSMGLMSRRDLRLLSVEDCILVCAQKNVISTAHTGDMRLRAKKTDSRPLLLHVNLDAGHGGASGRFEVLAEIAREYAFLIDQAGLARAR